MRWLRYLAPSDDQVARSASRWSNRRVAIRRETSLMWWCIGSEILHPPGCGQDCGGVLVLGVSACNTNRGARPRLGPLWGLMASERRLDGCRVGQDCVLKAPSSQAGFAAKG